MNQPTDLTQFNNTDPSELAMNSIRKTSKWNKLGLKTKVTLLSIALGLAPIGLIGGFSYIQIDNALKEQTAASQKSRAIEIADKFNRFIFERNGDVETLATQPIFADSKAAAITPVADKAKLLDQYVSSYQTYDSIAFFDLKGNPIAQSKGAPLKNHLDRAYFQAVLKTGKTVISDPEISVSTGKAVIHFAAPVKDSTTGQIIGVVRTRAPVERLEAPLKNFAGKSQDYHILDRSTGKLFISSNGEYTNKSADADVTAAIDKGGLVRHQNLVGDTTGEHVKQGDAGKATELLSAAPLGKIDGMQQLPWVAIASIDEDAAYATLSGLLLTILAGAGLTGLFTVALSTLIADRTTKPIEDAAIAVEKIGQGDFNSRVEVTSEDEIGQLGNNINLMGSQIKGLLHEQAEQTRRTELYAEISRARTGEDLVAPLSQILVEAREILKADRMVVYRFMADNRGYIAGESFGAGGSSALAEQVNDPCIPDGMLAAYAQGRVIANDTVSDGNYHPDHKALLSRLNIKSNLIVPIVQSGNLLGLLIAHHCRQAHAWQEWESIYLTKFAEQIGISLSGFVISERGQLEAVKQRDKAVREQMFASISRAQTSQEMAAPLAIILEESLTKLKADRVVVYRFFPSKGGHVVGEAVLPGFMKALDERIEDACIPQALMDDYAQGRTIATNDTMGSDYHPEHKQLFARLQIKSNLVVPILQGINVLGLLVAHHCQETHNWEEWETEYLQEFAKPIASCLGGFAATERSKYEADAASQRADTSKKENENRQKELLRLLMEIEGASEGDLTVRSEISDGEIAIVGDFFNSIIESLRDIVTTVK